MPSALVFGEHPSTRTFDDPLQECPTLASRAKLGVLARQEMSQIMAKIRLSRGLRLAIHPSADAAYFPGDRVLVWREKHVNNRIGEWVGSFTVQSFDPKRNSSMSGMTSMVRSPNLIRPKSGNIWSLTKLSIVSSRT